MVLQEIDKARYNRHVKITFAAIAVALVVISISISSVLIALFSTPDEPHFWFNLSGVVIAAILVVIVMSRLRGHPFLTEVVYVWDLKQALNRVYRKQQVLEQRAEENDPGAMALLLFQYRGSRQLYELDDNTVTLDELLPRLKRLTRKMEEANLETDVVAFDSDLLDRY